MPTNLKTPEEVLQIVMAERDELKAKLIAGPDKVLRCAFCGHEYPEGTPAFKSGALADHIKTCPDHPAYKEIVRVLKRIGGRLQITMEHIPEADAPHVLETRIIAELDRIL